MSGFSVNLDYEAARDVTESVLENSAKIIIDSLKYTRNRGDIERFFRVLDSINILLDHYNRNIVDTSLVEYLRPKANQPIEYLPIEDNMNYATTPSSMSYVSPNTTHQVYNPHTDVINNYDNLPSDVEPRQ